MDDYNKCNEIIGEKPNSHKIEGEISKECIEYILSQNSDELKSWKIFFLSFLHNNGHPSSFKTSSPFLSLSYGSEKFKVARKFAIGRSTHGKGIIFLYSLNANWPYYYRSIDLTKQLNQFGVKWYKDIHHEILLINGMYPHFMIGIFEVEKNKTSKFILNPWIFNNFKKNISFNYTEGVKIDQRNFHDFAKDLGYRYYFFHEEGRQMEYISELNKYENNRVHRV